MRKAYGIGIGLFLCAAILTIHGIGVKSAEAGSPNYPGVSTGNYSLDLACTTGQCTSGAVTSSVTTANTAGWNLGYDYECGSPTLGIDGGDDCYHVSGTHTNEFTGPGFNVDGSGNVTAVSVSFDGGSVGNLTVTGSETVARNFAVDGGGTFNNGLTVTAGGEVVTAGGLTVTAGGLTITAGGLTVTAGAISGNSVTRGTCTLGTSCASITVTASSVCTCSDTTSAAACKVALSGTTLTLTGTSTDVLNWQCQI